MQTNDNQRLSPIQVLVGATLFRFESCRAHHFTTKCDGLESRPVDRSTLLMSKGGDKRQIWLYSPLRDKAFQGSPAEGKFLEVTEPWFRTAKAL